MATDSEDPVRLLAHETWFTELRPPFTTDLLTDPVTIGFLIVVVGVTVAWRAVAARWHVPELRPLEPLGGLAPWVPRLLAVHAGVSLIAQAYAGTYLAPALRLADGPTGTALAILEGVVGVWLATGVRVRPAAWLLVAAGPLGMLAYGIVPILERVDLLGIGVFLALLPPGDDELGAVRPTPRALGRSLFALRLLIGGALVVLAFTEKLARPGLALAFLDQYPAFNLLATLGLDVPDLMFVRVAGAVELLFGLLIISGAAPQVVVIVAGLPFNATLFFLGASELIGHLPVYGAMAALLVYGSSTTYAPVVPWLPGGVSPSGRRRRAGDRTPGVPRPAEARGRPARGR